MKDIKDMTKDEVIDAYRAKVFELYEFANKVADETEHSPILFVSCGFEYDDHSEVINTTVYGSRKGITTALGNDPDLKGLIIGAARVSLIQGVLGEE